MKSSLLKFVVSDENLNQDTIPTCIGQIVEITEDYRAKIDYPGNPSGPVIARSIIRVQDYESLLHAPVVLIFEAIDPALPIIIGLIHESIFTPNIQEVYDVPKTKRHKVDIDGKRIVLEADKEIVLRCGRSSITLGANGKIVVKGKDLVSRASAANKIKGASVNIN